MYKRKRYKVSQSSERIQNLYGHNVGESPVATDDASSLHPRVGGLPPLVDGGKVVVVTEMVVC